MATNIVPTSCGRIGLKVEARRTGDQVFKRLVFAEKSYELALVYCDGFDNLYSSLDRWFSSKGADNISSIADAELDTLLDRWDKAVTPRTGWTSPSRSTAGSRSWPRSCPVHPPEGRLLPRAEGRGHRHRQSLPVGRRLVDEQLILCASFDFSHANC